MAKSKRQKKNKWGSCYCDVCKGVVTVERFAGDTAQDIEDRHYELHDGWVALPDEEVITIPIAEVEAPAIETPVVDVPQDNNCPKCDREFTTSNGLKTHLRWHAKVDATPAYAPLRSIEEMLEEQAVMAKAMAAEAQVKAEAQKLAHEQASAKYAEVSSLEDQLIRAEGAYESLLANEFVSQEAVRGAFAILTEIGKRLDVERSSPEYILGKAVHKQVLLTNKLDTIQSDNKERIADAVAQLELEAQAPYADWDDLMDGTEWVPGKAEAMPFMVWAYIHTNVRAIQTGLEKGSSRTWTNIEDSDILADVWKDDVVSRYCLRFPEGNLTSKVKIMVADADGNVTPQWEKISFNTGRSYDGERERFFGALRKLWNETASLYGDDTVQRAAKNLMMWGSGASKRSTSKIWWPSKAAQSANDSQLGVELKEKVINRAYAKDDGKVVEQR